MYSIISIPFLYMLFVINICIAESNFLNLEESIQIAILNNKNLHSAWLEMKIAQLKVKEAKLKCLPTFKLSANYTRLDEPPIIEIAPIKGSSIKIGDENIYDIKTTLIQPLFTGGKIINAYRIAKANLKIVEYNYIKLKNELKLKVKEAYFNVLKAKKFYEIAQESLNQLKAHLELVRKYYKVGMATTVDILKAELQLAQAKQELIKAENRLKLTQAYFNNILGRDLETKVNLVDIIEFEKLNLSLEGCLKEAFLKRVELKTINENLKSTELKILLNKSDYYPQIFLFSNYGYEKGKKLPIEWEKNWEVGVTFNFTLWDWNVTRRKVAQAVIEFEILNDKKDQLKKSIALEVREAYLSLKELEEAINVREKSVLTAEENFSLQEALYKEGAAKTVDVLDAQTLLTKAKIDYYQALYDYHIAKAKLKRAIGE